MATYTARVPDLPLVASVEATQWKQNGDHPLDYERDEQGFETTDGVQQLRTFTGAERKAKGWEGSVVRYFRHPDFPGHRACKQCGHSYNAHGWLDTGGAGQAVCPGDYVVTVPFDSGRPDRPKYAAISAEAFEATYMLARS